MCRGYTVPFHKSSTGVSAHHHHAEDGADSHFDGDFVPVPSKKETLQLVDGHQFAVSAEGGSGSHAWESDLQEGLLGPAEFNNNDWKPRVSAALSLMKTAPKKPTLRPDLDMDLQRRLVDQERADRRAKLDKADGCASLYGRLAPSDNAKTMVYSRHTLRQLVIEARNQQIANAAKPPIRRTRAYLALCAGVSGTKKREPPMDLKNDDNFRGLLHDIDTLMEVAQTKAHYTRERILTQTFEQLSRLRIWVNDNEVEEDEEEEADELGDCWSAQASMPSHNFAGFP